MQNTKDTNRDHNAPIFYHDPKTGKPIDTGLKKAALEDYNKRLIDLNKKPHNGGR